MMHGDGEDFAERMLSEYGQLERTLGTDAYQALVADKQEQIASSQEVRRVMVAQAERIESFSIALRAGVLVFLLFTLPTFVWFCGLVWRSFQ